MSLPTTFSAPFAHLRHTVAFLGYSTGGEAVVISLGTGSGSLIENPTSADISAALKALHSVEEVLTVTDGDGLSLDAARAHGGQFHLGYEDSRAGNIYTARTVALAYSTALKLFCLLAKENPNWRTVIRWQRRAKPLKQAEQQKQPEQTEQRKQPELSEVSYMIGCLAVALLVQIMIVAVVYRGLESGYGVAVPIVAIPLFILAGLLTPLGLSEAAAVAVAMALAFLVLDIAVLISRR